LPVSTGYQMKSTSLLSPQELPQQAISLPIAQVASPDVFSI
jgi:hypothetical protein